MNTSTINVEGMSCGHCKASVEKALTGLQGVQTAEVDLNTGTVDVVYDGSALDMPQLHTAIEEAGYSVKV